MKTRKENKKGVSLIISYVLLIVIGVTISIVVYNVIMKVIGDVDKGAECTSSVGLIITNYSCDTINDKITISVKNNGMFNIAGYDIRGARTSSEPTAEALTIDMAGLSPEVAAKGRYFFSYSSLSRQLKPGEVLQGTDSQTFSYSRLTLGAGGAQLGEIEIQPFIFAEGTNDPILCESSIIRLEIDGCN